jgi:hypothetical protein
MTESEKPAAAAEQRTVEEWRAVKAPADWVFAAARAGNRWPIGLLVTESEFDDALERAAHVTAG